MKKRFVVALAALLFLGTTSAFAETGIGLQLNSIVNKGGFGGFNPAVTFQIDAVPLVFSAGAKYDGYSTSVNLAADWWIDNPTISGPFSWFYGVGLATGFSFGYYKYFNIGPRAVIGANVFVASDKLEIYAQGAYQPMAWVGDIYGFDWTNIPFDIGVRYWF